MACKSKKMKYALGGDALGFMGDLGKTAINVGSSLVGMPGLDIENETLQKISDVGSKLNPALASGALNLVAPGLGSAYSMGHQALSGVLEEEFGADADTFTKEVLNINPAYLKSFKDGGQISIMPQTEGTDTIPIDGMGNPAQTSGRKGVALADSGEVIWNGYVFSDDLGFSDKAKSVLNRYKLRLGEKFDGTDKISREQMDRELADIADDQETYKESMGIQDSSEGYANGGKIEIDASKKGSFTSAASRRGLGVQEFASHVLANKEKYTPSMVKKANFARNASQWSKNSMGGYGTLMAPIISDIINSRTHVDLDPITITGQGGLKMTGKGTSGMDANSFFNLKPDVQNSYLSNSSLAPISAENQTRLNTMPTGSGSSALDFLQQPETLGALSQAGILGLRALNMASGKDDSITRRSVVPNTINLDEGREDLKRERDVMAAQSRRMYRGNTAAQIAAMSTLDRAMGRGINESYMEERKYNADARSRADATNLASSMQYDDLKARESGAKKSAYDAMLTDASGIITGSMVDKQKVEMEKLMMNMFRDFVRNYMYDEGTGSVKLKR